MRNYTLALLLLATGLHAAQADKAEKSKSTDDAAIVAPVASPATPPGQNKEGQVSDDNGQNTDNGWHGNKPRLADAQVILDDTKARLLALQVAATKAGDLDTAVAIRTLIAQLSGAPTPAPTPEEVRVNCTLMFFEPNGLPGTPTLHWSNGTVTHLTKVGNQNGDCIQEIWMATMPPHRWSDSIILEPGIPQSTLTGKP